jgi:exopolysaccharide production protein ExoQ
MTRAVSLLGHRLRITPELRDHALITLWIIVTFRQFPRDELILYPLALYFFWTFVRDFPRLFDLVARSAVLWAFPLWYLLSTTWSPDPGGALRTTLQLVLTFMICYCAVLRLGPRQLMLSVLIGAGWQGVLSFLADPSGISTRGVFASKNALGTAMVVLWVSALCVLLDRGFRTWIRLVGLAACLLALRMIQVAESATAVLLALAATVIVIALRGRGLIPAAALAAMTALMCAAIAAGLAFVAVTMTEFDPVGRVLGYFGKDTTLTGRTVLWAYAAEVIAEHPLLGVGHGGFWTPYDGFSTARRIYNEFHKPPYANFSFHSSYYETAVHHGLIGLALLVAATLWCLWRIGLAALLVTGMPAIFFVCISLITLARSFTEVGLMSPFALLFMLFVMGALFTLKGPPAAPARPPARPPAHPPGPAPEAAPEAVPPPPRRGPAAGEA